MKTISRILLFLISTGFISIQMACKSEFELCKSIEAIDQVIKSLINN